MSTGMWRKLQNRLPMFTAHGVRQRDPRWKEEVGPRAAATRQKTIESMKEQRVALVTFAALQTDPRLEEMELLKAASLVAPSLLKAPQLKADPQLTGVIPPRPDLPHNRRRLHRLCEMYLRH